ncbi:unnamed protein product, partial [Sphacelaria rigidula]
MRGLGVSPTPSSQSANACVISPTRRPRRARRDRPRHRTKLCLGASDTCPLHGNFGYLETGTREYCGLHQLPGMVNLARFAMNAKKAETLRGGGAWKASRNNARYANAEGKPASRKAAAKSAARVGSGIAAVRKTSHKIACYAPGCLVAARFGHRDGQRTYCGTHKAADMVNLDKNKIKKRLRLGAAAAFTATATATVAAAVAVSSTPAGRRKQAAKVRKKAKIGTVPAKKGQRTTAVGNKCVAVTKARSCRSNSGGRTAISKKCGASTAGRAIVGRGGAKRSAPVRAKPQRVLKKLGTGGRGRILSADKRTTGAEKSDTENQSKKQLCADPSCYKHASFGFIGGSCDYCKDHGLPGMVNLKTLRGKKRLLRQSGSTDKRINSTSLVSAIPGKRKRPSGVDAERRSRSANLTLTRKKKRGIAGSSSGSAGKGVVSSGLLSRSSGVLRARTSAAVELGAVKSKGKGKVRDTSKGKGKAMVTSRHLSKPAPAKSTGAGSARGKARSSSGGR